MKDMLVGKMIEFRVWVGILWGFSSKRCIVNFFGF